MLKRRLRFLLVLGLGPALFGVCISIIIPVAILVALNRSQAVTALATPRSIPGLKLYSHAVPGDHQLVWFGGSLTGRYSALQRALMPIDYLSWKLEARGTISTTASLHRPPSWSAIHGDSGQSAIALLSTGVEDVYIFDVGAGYPLRSFTTHSIVIRDDGLLSLVGHSNPEPLRSDAVGFPPISGVWVPGLILNAAAWASVLFVLGGGPWWVYRFVVLRQRFRSQRCLVCGHGMAGLSACPECRTIRGELRPRMPEQADEAGSERLTAAGLTWLGWSAAPVVAAWLVLCGAAVLMPWRWLWNHYTSEFWGVMRVLGFAGFVVAGCCAVGASRGMVLCAEGEARRMGAVGQFGRTTCLLIGIVSGVAGSMGGILALMLSRKREFHLWESWNDVIIGGVSFFLLMIFFVIGLGFVRRAVALRGDEKEGWRMARRGWAMLASCLVCGCFAWLSGTNDASDVAWIWWICVGVFAFGAIESVVFCVRFTRGCLRSARELEMAESDQLRG